MKYVIIGNSAAGTAAVEAIREYDKDGRIIALSEEPDANYSRPLISYLLGKKVAPENMAFCKDDFYRVNNAELILNKKVTKLETKKKYVILSDRKRIAFDRLLIATGGIPIIPKIKGIDLKGAFTFTKLADAKKIEKYIKANKVKKATVIGGGLIGLKATEALMELGIKVTIIELADRILSSTFDKKASSIIETALEKVGCSLITNNTVEEIKAKGKKVKEIVLKNQRKIPTDLVIVAIGVRPNIDLVKDTSIKTHRGIKVDTFMETNIKLIYAAGDCCEGGIAIWPVAVRQGKIAGRNMAGMKKEYEGSFLMNSVELCGIPTISVGKTDLDGNGYQCLEHFEQDKSLYKKIILKNNRIVGAIFVGEIERSGIYTGLIRDKVDTTPFKEHLLEEDFGLISLPKEYRKHLIEKEAAII